MLDGKIRIFLTTRILFTHIRNYNYIAIRHTSPYTFRSHMDRDELHSLYAGLTLHVISASKILTLSALPKFLRYQHHQNSRYQHYQNSRYQHHQNSYVISTTKIHVISTNKILTFVPDKINEVDRP